MHKKHTKKSKSYNSNKNAIDIENNKKFEEKSESNRWISALKQDPVTDEQSHVQTNYRQLR